MKRMIKSSSIGEYVGRKLLTDWTVQLLVYGAEESEFYDLEQSFTGTLNECIRKSKEYFKILRDNDADGYVTIEANRTGEYFEFDGFYDVQEQFPDEVEEVFGESSSWIQASYVPDMTQRYPEGDRDSGGYVSDYDSYGYEPDFEPMTVQDAIDDADHFFGGNWNDVTVHDTDGVDYYAGYGHLDEIPDYILNKSVNKYDWDSIKREIYIWTANF